MEGQMGRARYALMRVGEPELQTYVGREVVQYIALLGSTTSASGLADVLLRRWGSDLFSPTHRQLRDQVINGLPRKDAEALERLLTGRASEDPWRACLALDLSPGTAAYSKLLQFFKIPEPVLEPRREPAPSETRIPGGYPLYSYQSATVAKARDELRRGDRRVLIHMPTGAGKTRAAMALIAQVLRDAVQGTVVVWLAHSEELCDQAAGEFIKCWQKVGDRDVHVGRFYGPYELDLSGFRDGLLVAGLPKLYSRSLRSQSDFLQLKRHTSLTVMDEAHQAVAPTYQHLLEMLAPIGSEVGLLGLSATPGRSWLDIGQDEALASFFTRRKVTLQTPSSIDPISFLQKEGYLAVPDYRFVPYKPSLVLSTKEKEELARGFDISPDALRRLGDDKQRNLLIIQETLQRVAAGDRILIFACSVEHAELLADVLAVKGVRAAAVSAKTPAWSRQSILESFREQQEDALQVVVNFGILTAGFDAPKTNAVVIARPTQSVVLYSQMIGRALRGPRSGGNAKATIITVKDHLPGFRSVYEGFRFWEDVW
jgi:superfamily II DNA or RNA helicase